MQLHSFPTFKFVMLFALLFLCCSLSDGKQDTCNSMMIAKFSATGQDGKPCRLGNHGLKKWFQDVDYKTRYCWGFGKRLGRCGTYRQNLESLKRSHDCSRPYYQFRPNFSRAANACLREYALFHKSGPSNYCSAYSYIGYYNVNTYGERESFTFILDFIDITIYTIRLYKHSNSFVGRSLPLSIDLVPSSLPGS